MRQSLHTSGRLLQLSGYAPTTKGNISESRKCTLDADNGWASWLAEENALHMNDVIVTDSDDDLVVEEEACLCVEMQGSYP